VNYWQNTPKRKEKLLKQHSAASKS